MNSWYLESKYFCPTVDKENIGQRITGHEVAVALHKYSSILSLTSGVDMFWWSKK
jgi:hypothetical protein